MQIAYFHPDIKDFFNTLEDKVSAKVSNTVQLLSMKEYHLSMPYSKKIEKDLYELRISSLQNIRVFYTFNKGQIVLLHAINKKTQKLELNDLKTARNRLALLHS